MSDETGGLLFILDFDGEGDQIRDGRSTLLWKGCHKERVSQGKAVTRKECHRERLSQGKGVTGRQGFLFKAAEDLLLDGIEACPRVECSCFASAASVFSLYFSL
eukprot:1153004-Pelagomonas_calceolata.AAC.3